MSSSSSYLTPGTLLRDYRVESVLGRGGQGVVYLAEHVHLRRRVALKVLPPEFADDEDFRDRFLREARLAASLEHPNILSVYDAGEADGVLFLAMRLVQGVDLGEVLVRDGALEPARALEVLAKVASALDEAHSKGLVHRDVKPSNILLEGEDRVFLSDFGLGKAFGEPGQPQPGQPGGVGSEAGAGSDPGSGSHSGSGPGPHESRAITRAGYFVGTPHYAAPEQIQGGPIGPWTDEYALAAVLFETLTGRVPFPSSVETATLVAHVTERVPAPSSIQPHLPGALDAVVTAGMGKRPQDRYRSCSDLITAARSALMGGRTVAVPAPVVPGAPGPPAPPAPPAPPVPMPAGPPRTPPDPPRRRVRPWMIGAAAGLVLVLVVGIITLGGDGLPGPGPTGAATTGVVPTGGPTPGPTTAVEPTTAPTTGPPPTTEPPPTTGPPPLTRTEVVAVEPFNGAGNLQPPFVQTEEHSGSCFTGSLVNSSPDAWRCFADNNSQIFDPCFGNFGDVSSRVGCLASPLDNGVVLINLTEDLPAASANPPGGEPGDWAVQLEDNGTVCLRFGGAHDLEIN